MHSQINLKINETKENYEKMLYKEALRTGFYENQAAKDKYLLLSALDGPNWDLILHFIEIQTIIMAPICPHVAEHVWSLMNKTGSILNARWPAAGVIDEILVKSSQYLMEAAHSFRILLKNHLTVKKPSKGSTQVTTIEIPTTGTIWVAKTFPPWQTIVLTTMKQLFQKNGGKLPDNKLIASELSSKSELKKYMKRVMPFVQATREKMDTLGVVALNLTLDFDEFEVLKLNEDYLRNTLNLEEIVIKFTDEASEKTKEDCCPGAPYISFSAKPGLTVNAVNPQKSSGLFTKNIKICQGDTAATIAGRIAKDTKLIKDPSSIRLYRYEDVDLGPRTIPRGDDVLNGRIEIPADAVFDVKFETSTIELKLGNQNYRVGRDILYIIRE